MAGLFLSALALSSLLHAAEPAGKAFLVYVGTYTDHGSKGIYAARFDSSTGKLTSLGLAGESAEPSFLTVDSGGRFLYAVNEVSNYNGQAVGAVSAFAIQGENGKLTLLNQLSSSGDGPAHITLDHSGKFALVSNYTHGSVAVFPVLTDGRLGETSSFVQHQGSSIDPDRQKEPHAHAVALSPDNRFAVVADLGLDQLLIYRFDAAKGTLGADPQSVRSAPGAGPRHLDFSSDGRFLYVINEMKSTVVTYLYEAAAGRLHELQTISTLPKGFKGDSSAAEIELHPSGKFLFASNRGDDSIAVFVIDPRAGTPTLVEIDSVAGKTPRNFAIDPTGSWLLAANQDSNQIIVFHIDNNSGHLIRTGEPFPVQSPTCVKFGAPR